MTPTTGYTRLQIALHWTIAMLVVAAWLASEDVDDVLEARLDADLGPLTGAPLHVWLGISVLVLAVIRLVVRLRHGAPEPTGSPPVQLAARWGHRLLYLLMFAVPLSGMLTWGAGIEDMGDLHELAANGFLLVALGHALAAILHSAMAGDATMSRMFTPRDR